MSDAIVLDANVGASIVSDDEPDHDAATACYDAIVDFGARPIVPDLFLYEVGNVLSRSKTAKGRAARYLDALELADVERPSITVLERALEIAASHRLSFYDATYVALAESRDAKLWTQDRLIRDRFPRLSIDTAHLASAYEKR